MKRMIRAAAAAAVLTGGLGSVGCVHTAGNGDRGQSTLGDHYRNYIDPCYPERYNHAARQATIYPFAQQVHNGHVLNQTIWTYYFGADEQKRDMVLTALANLVDPAVLPDDPKDKKDLLEKRKEVKAAAVETLRQHADARFRDRLDQLAKGLNSADAKERAAAQELAEEIRYYASLADGLTPAGMQKLDSIARTRPAPDPKLYLQAAMDVPVTAANAAKINDLRAELDAKRAAAVQKYLTTVPAVAPVAYEIYVHNPATPGIIAEAGAAAYRASLLGYSGGITGAAGIGTLGTGGSTNLTVAPVINNAGAGSGGTPGAPR